MDQVSESIMFRGLDLPPRIYPGLEYRSRCPDCSATREKHWEKCVSIKWRDDGLSFRCYHCGWTDLEVVK